MEVFFFIINFIKLNIEINFFFSLFFFTIFLLIYNSFSIPGNGIFMAVGNDEIIYKSTDGDTWTKVYPL